MQALNRTARCWPTCVAAFLMLVGLASCGSQQRITPADEARDALGSLDAPLDRLRDALSSPLRGRKQVLIIRASSARAESALRRAGDELKDLSAAASSSDRRRIDDQIDAVEAIQVLTKVLAEGGHGIEELGLAAESANRAIDDAGLDLPIIGAAKLVRAERARRHERDPVPSRPVGGDPATTSSDPALSFMTYRGPAFHARLPTGDGWDSPSQSEPTPGRLFRTNVRGPGGAFVIIDYTPYEAAVFGGSYSSRTQVGQTAFGTAARYVFQGGSLPECQRSTCVDYIINDRSNGSGFGVLAGGPDFDAASSLARTVAESVVPSPDGE